MYISGGAPPGSEAAKTTVGVVKTPESKIEGRKKERKYMGRKRKEPETLLKWEPTGLKSMGKEHVYRLDGSNLYLNNEQVPTIKAPTPEVAMQVAELLEAESQKEKE